MARNTFSRGEFMDFMDDYLNAHPEVVEDQKTGWDIYWNPSNIETPDEIQTILTESFSLDDLQYSLAIAVPAHNQVHAS
jgi:hypothetical protein